MNRYRVLVRRDQGAWLADMPELQGAHTFAASLVLLDRYVREVIVLAAHLPDDAGSTVDLRWEFHSGRKALGAHD